jgi:hypothetical protein
VDVDPVAWSSNAQGMDQSPTGTPSRKAAPDHAIPSAVWETTADLLLSMVQRGLARSGWAEVLVSAVWFGSVGLGGMTARMTTKASKHTPSPTDHESTSRRKPSSVAITVPNFCSIVCSGGDLARPGSGPADRRAAGAVRGAARCGYGTVASWPPRSSRTSALTAPGSGASCSWSGNSDPRPTAGAAAATSTADRPQPPPRSQAGHRSA